MLHNQFSSCIWKTATYFVKKCYLSSTSQIQDVLMMINFTRNVREHNRNFLILYSSTTEMRIYYWSWLKEFYQKIGMKLKWSDVEVLTVFWYHLSTKNKKFPWTSSNMYTRAVRWWENQNALNPVNRFKGPGSFKTFFRKCGVASVNATINNITIEIPVIPSIPVKRYL